MAKDDKPSRAATGRKALQAFLRTHWGGAATLGLPPYDGKRLPDTDMRTLVGLLRIVRWNIGLGEWEVVNEGLGFLPLFADVLAEPRNAGHEQRLENLLGAVAKRSTDKATLHAGRLLNVIRLVAADTPLEDGQRVSVQRTRHGWFGKSGVVGTVRAGSRGRIVDGDDGCEYEIEHRRDVR